MPNCFWAPSAPFAFRCPVHCNSGYVVIALPQHMPIHLHLLPVTRVRIFSCLVCYWHILFSNTAVSFNITLYFTKKVKTITKQKMRNRQIDAGLKETGKLAGGLDSEASGPGMSSGWGHCAIYVLGQDMLLCTMPGSTQVYK